VLTEGNWFSLINSSSDFQDVEVVWSEFMIWILLYLMLFDGHFMK